MQTQIVTKKIPLMLSQSQIKHKPCTHNWYCSSGTQFTSTERTLEETHSNSVPFLRCAPTKRNTLKANAAICPNVVSTIRPLPPENGNRSFVHQPFTPPHAAHGNTLHCLQHLIHKIIQPNRIRCMNKHAILITCNTTSQRPSLKQYSQT